MNKNNSNTNLEVKVGIFLLFLSMLIYKINGVLLVKIIPNVIQNL